MSHHISLQQSGLPHIILIGYLDSLVLHDLSTNQAARPARSLLAYAIADGYSQCLHVLPNYRIR